MPVNLYYTQKVGSSTVYDRTGQKNIKIRKTELKKTGIAPVIRCLKKIFKWTGMDKSGQNERWSETVEANSEVHAVHKVHRRPCERRCFFSLKEIWVSVTNRRRGKKPSDFLQYLNHNAVVRLHFITAGQTSSAASHPLYALSIHPLVAEWLAQT